MSRRPSQRSVASLSRAGRPGEFELIARYFAPLAADYPGAGGLQHDIAVIAVPEGRELIVKTDAIVASVHFLPDDPPDQVARKALRVNLSDLAAGGGVPLAYQLALSLPPAWTEAWVARFAEGLAADQGLFGIGLAGGDTVATPGPLTVSITAFGTVARGAALGRGGARPGDDIWVTGTIGDAFLGLRVLRNGLPGLDGAHATFLADRYRLPQPRLALGRQLPGLARATIDVSDGLVADLRHVCTVSGVGARLDAALVPLSAAAGAALQTDAARLSELLTGGDDYELLIIADPADRDRLERAADGAETRLTRIGEIVAGREVEVTEAGQGIALPRAGFTHF